MKDIKKTLIVISGCINILFGLLHASFWKTFDWNNNQVIIKTYSIVMQMLNLGMLVMLFSLGIVFIVFRHEIISSRLGKAILLSMVLFYSARFVADFIFSTTSVFLSALLLLCIILNLIPAIDFKRMES